MAKALKARILVEHIVQKRKPRNAMCCNLKHFFNNLATDQRTVLVVLGHILCL